MKKLLATLTAAILLATPALAQARPKYMDFCEHLADVAEMFMWHRQLGEPIESVLEWIDRSAPRLSVHEVWTDMVIAAYSVPVYNTPEYKPLAVISFGNAARDTCIEMHGGSI